MANGETNTREAGVLKKTDRETGFSVRLHFSDMGGDGAAERDAQKLLTEAYIKSLSTRGE